MEIDAKLHERIRKIEQIALEMSDCIPSRPDYAGDVYQANREDTIARHYVAIGERCGLVIALSILNDSSVDDEMEALYDAWVNSRTD